jgi:outer membrane biosynthesis protein TonB
MLAGAKIDGVVVVGFTIQRTGAIDTAQANVYRATKIEVYRSTHDLFTHAVRDAIASWTAEPARLRGRPVRQWVEYEFRFLTECRGPPRMLPLARASRGIHVVEICESG